jgi:hypothetical protein
MSLGKRSGVKAKLSKLDAKASFLSTIRRRKKEPTQIRTIVQKLLSNKLALSRIDVEIRPLCK